MAAANKAFDNSVEDGFTDVPLQKRRHSQYEPSIASGPEPEGLMAIWREWPKRVFCIVGNEFCERFSYYGMRTILSLYFLNILGFGDDLATALFSAFNVLAYSTPLLGSILADGYIGKFKTIMWISLLYALGNIIFALAAALDPKLALHPWLDLLGLCIIALGTGGIKPCVSAFGGDQFKIGQEKMISIFFSVFYFSINAGSTLSVFATPLLRTSQCLGRDSCYPLAFGVPAVLMIVAVAAFVIGSPWYKKYPPKENIFAEVMRAVMQALRNKNFFNVSRNHWMDHYMDSHSCEMDDKCTKNKCHKAQLVDDIKAVFRVIIMYIPVPVFWALFDQQGSRWIIQGVAMKSEIFPGVRILPDQIQIFNPILIMIFIPIFQGIIYPFFRWIKLEPTPLRRMGMGGFIAAAAYVISALVQLRVNPTLPQIPSGGEFHMAMLNTFDCDVTFTSPNYHPIDVMAHGSAIGQYSFKDKMITWTTNHTGGCIIPPTFTTKVESGGSYYTVFAATIGTFEADLEKARSGQGETKVNLNVFYNENNVYAKHPNASRKGFLFCRGGTAANPCDPKTLDNFAMVQRYPIPKHKQTDNRTTTYAKLKPSNKLEWQVYLPIGDYDYAGKTMEKIRQDHRVPIPLKNVTFFLKEGSQEGGILTNAITDATIPPSGVYAQDVHTIANFNSVPIIWQAPQYIVITAAEILFSITGLEFSYSQAPKSMKSLIQALWLLTVAAGDCIIILIAISRPFKNLAVEFLAYAVLMAVVMIIFMMEAVFYYKYTFYTRTDDENEAGGKDNEAVTED